MIISWAGTEIKKSKQRICRFSGSFCYLTPVCCLYIRHVEPCFACLAANPHLTDKKIQPPAFKPIWQIKKRAFDLHGWAIFKEFLMIQLQDMGTPILHLQEKMSLGERRSFSNWQAPCPRVEMGSYSNLSLLAISILKPDWQVFVFSCRQNRSTRCHIHMARSSMRERGGTMRKDVDDNPAGF